MTEEITDEQVKSAIRTAARSLARSEQCRAALERKLLQKEFDENSVRQALDFLEKKHYLDDERFASSWIRTHCTYKPQGRIRILRELLSRGVKKNVAENAIRDYFSNIDEESLCEEAFKRYFAKKKDLHKIMKSLADSGFSYAIIQRILKSKMEGQDFGTE